MAVERSSREVIAQMVSLWDTCGLDAYFRSQRDDPSDARDVLWEVEAMPGTPYPYAVFEQTPGTRNQHQSFSNTEGRAIRNTNWRFKLYDKDKDRLADLADKVLDCYHKNRLCLANGAGLIAKLQSEWSTPAGDDEFLWTIDLELIWDAPTNP